MAKNTGNSRETWNVWWFIGISVSKNSGPFWGGPYRDDSLRWSILGSCFWKPLDKWYFE